MVHLIKNKLRRQIVELCAATGMRYDAAIGRHKSMIDLAGIRDALRALKSFQIKQTGGIKNDG